MNSKSMMMLVGAVLCGLGAMYGTTKLMKRPASAPVVEMQDVLVAVKDLKLEEVLKPESVKVVRMAKASVPPGTFSSVKDVEGRWVQMAMLTDEPVVDKKLAARGTPTGIIPRIPSGMRAFAVEVNEQTGVSGFVLPDHRVDVVQVGSLQNGRAEAETVLQDVLVLAAGQTFSRPEDKSIQARTVTLAVTPEQVDTLVEAKARGALSLALRGLNDHVRNAPRKPKKEPEPPPPPKVEPVVVKAPEPPPPPEPAPAPAPPPPPAPKFVTLYRGLDNVTRVRIDQPPPAPEAEALADATPASPAFDNSPAPRN